MSIQASNAKIAVVVATLLAEVDAHGWLQGKPSEEATQSKFEDDTPSSRQQFFSFFEEGADRAYNNYVNAAENRVTRTSVDGPENEIHPTMEQCPPIWAGTEGACMMDENKHCIGNVNGQYKDGKDDDTFRGIGVCEYSTLDEHGVYSPPIYGTGINTGCCGGWSDMKQFEHTLTTGGQKNTENGLMENGEDAVDENGKVRKSVCFTMDYENASQGHFGIPITNSTLPHSKQAALNVDNYTPEVQNKDGFFKTYTAGTTVDLSWVSTVMHGGMVEYSIVCDGDESYENFKNNRLEYDDECGEEEHCGMFDQTDTFIRPNIISNGVGEKNGKKHWSFVPDADFHTQSGVNANSFFRTRSRIPRSLNTGSDNKRCTLAWFWWGKNSEGVFTACSDIIIAPASGVRSN